MDLRSKRQQVSAFLLRQGLHYSQDKKTWTKTHMNWLASQKLEHPEQRIAFEELMLAVRQAQERLERLEQAIRAAVPDWSLAEVVNGVDGDARHGSDLGGNVPGRDRRPLALPNADRADGISRLGAVGGFELRNSSSVARSPRPATGVPRRMLVECAWSYQHPPAGGSAQAAEG